MRFLLCFDVVKRNLRINLLDIFWRAGGRKRELEMDGRGPRVFA